MADLRIDFAGVVLRNPVLLASGTCNYGQELLPLTDFSRLGGLVTNAYIDEIYEQAKNAGAIGGKLLGAGGGGFMLLFAPPEKQALVKERLGQLIQVPFQFESTGTQIIFYDHDEDYTGVEQARMTQRIQAFRELS